MKIKLLLSIFIFCNINENHAQSWPRPWEEPDASKYISPNAYPQAYRDESIQDNYFGTIVSYQS